MKTVAKGSDEKKPDNNKKTLGQEALELHKTLRGKIELRSKVSVKTPKE